MAVPSAIVGSSCVGALMIGAPLFQRPTICAPNKSGEALSDEPAMVAEAFFTEALNYGTNCARRRNTRNEPLFMKGTGVL
jgi:hypothetical protein